MGLIHSLRLRIRAELEAAPEHRRFGTGWISGVGAMVFSVASLLLVVSLRHPGWLGMPELKAIHSHPAFPLAIQFALVVSFALAALNMVLRRNKTLGVVAMILTLLAALLGTAASAQQTVGEDKITIFFGLDWFVLNVIFTGFLFVPLERLFPRTAGQPLFRAEWREDLFYYLVSSMFVQVLTWLSFAPARFVTSHTHWTDFRAWVAGQPLWIQLLEIMFLTDLVQYWVHRLFHRIPALWKFHAVHHSAKSMDWMASARMHFLEIIILRGTTVMPMLVLGFNYGAVQFYVLLVYVHSTFIHANVKWDFEWLGRVLVTPRFHHWHHGIEKEAIDVNFAIHFPLLDRVFGTCHWPKHRWPQGYGIPGEMPSGYWQQFLHPFRRPKKKSPTPPPPSEAQG